MAVSDIGVVRIVDALAAAGVPPRIAGSWGRDAWGERVTRVHRDLDLVVAPAELDTVLATLAERGLAVSERTDDRVVLDDGVQWVDLHVGDPEARAWASGLIAGRPVTCERPS